MRKRNQKTPAISSTEANVRQQIDDDFVVDCLNDDCCWSGLLSECNKIDICEFGLCPKCNSETEAPNELIA